MRKGIVIILLIHFYSVLAIAQSQEGQVDSAMLPKLSYHYQQEFTSDKSIHPERWNSEAGLHVGFGSTDQLYFRAEVPDLKKDTKTWKAIGWKGERLNAQILVWSSDTVEQVRFKVNNLVSDKGNIINKDHINVNMVRYVIANYPYGAGDVTCGQSPYKDGYLMPDRFEQFDRFDVPGKTARPVWVGLDLPATAVAGHYKGTIEVKAKGFSTILKVEIDVQDQTLPKPHDWKYRLDLWQNPWVVAWDNHLEPWSEEHKLLLKKHLKLYADAGGKYITTYAVHSPWSDNSYSIEGAMIESIKQEDGKWKFDYKIFDEYVELAMSVGIDKAITVYTPLPGGFRFRYMDAKTGNYVTEKWPPTSEQFKAYLNPFLDDLQAHLRQKGWFDKTYIGINENPLDETLAGIKAVKSNSAKWRITYAGDWHPELKDLLDDYSYVARKESSMDVVKERAAKGFTTTYYVCCNPPKPNNFLFSPPIEGRWISWYASAYGYDGFLRWAYDAWTQDPNRDGRHGSWAAGDCYMVYPGGNSGIRFEKLREGIVDYEKLRILKELVAKSTDNKVHKMLADLDAHLSKLTVEHVYNEDVLKTQIYQGQKMIKDISDRLSRKQ